MVNFEALTRYKIVVVYPHFSKLNSWQSEITFCSNHDLRGRSQSDVVHCKKPGARCCRDPTVFALGDVAAFVASLGVCGVAPGADAIPIWVPAVVQLQTISGCGGPPEMNRDRTAVTAQPHSDYILDFKKMLIVKFYFCMYWNSLWASSRWNFPPAVTLNLLLVLSWLILATGLQENPTSSPPHSCI